MNKSFRHLFFFWQCHNNRRVIALISCTVFLLCAGCATVGHEFPADQVKTIQVGKTSKEEIRKTFGEPWRVGLEDGLETWSYGRYQYRMFSEKDAMDLVVRFNDRDIVESYTFNTTNPESAP